MSKKGRPRRGSPLRPSEHAMTAEDWKAFYLVMKLAEQVALHGRKALHTFIRAIKLDRDA